MSHSLLFVIIAAVVVLGLVLVSGLAVLGIREAKRNRERFPALLNAAGLALPEPGEIQRNNHNGVDYTYRFVSHRNRPIQLIFAVAHKNRGHLTIRRERGVDRVFKRLGIAVETQTGSLDFDDAYFIESGEPVFARSMLSSVETRQAVDTIMQCGFNRVVLDEDGIRAEITKAVAVSDRNHSVLDVVTALHQLSVEQPRIPDHLGRDQRFAWKFRLGLIYGLLGTLAAAGLWFLFFRSLHDRPLYPSALFEASFPLSAGSIVICFATLFLLLRGHSTSHRHLGFTTIILLPTALMSGYIGFHLTNVLKDRSSVVTHELLVLDKRSSGTRHRSYKITVPSWRQANTTEILHVPRKLYSKLVPQRSSISVGTRAGHLGFEWVAVAPQAIDHHEPATGSSRPPSGLR